MNKLVLKKYDKRWIGITIGLVAPLLVLLVVFILNVRKYGGMGNYISYLEKVGLYIDFFGDFVSPQISLCAIINLGIFFLFIWKNLLRSAQGVIMATLIYTMVVVIFKYII